MKIANLHEGMLGDIHGADRKLQRQQSAMVAEATKDGPSSRRSDASSTETSDSQRARLEQRRKQLQEKQAQVAAAAVNDDSASADTTVSQRERLEQRRKDLAARQAQHRSKFQAGIDPDAEA